MSSFLRKGKRIQVKDINKKVKRHKKEFYKILEELNVVMLQILSKEDLTTLTPDNIEEVASKYTEREIGIFEKNILLSKLENYKNRVQNENNKR